MRGRLLRRLLRGRFIAGLRGRAVSQRHLAGNLLLRPRGTLGGSRSGRTDSPRFDGAVLEGVADNIGGNLTALGALKRLDHILNGLGIKVRQIEVHVVQDIVHLNMHLHGCSDHSAEQLRDIGRVRSTTERHHGFSARAIPAGGEVLLEENHLDVLLVRNTGRLQISDRDTIDLDGAGRLAEGMHNFSVLETESCPLLNLPEAVIQIGIGDAAAGLVLHLNHEHRIHVGVVLLLTILRPVLPFLLPVIGSSLQHGHILASRGILRIGDDDSVLQQTGGPHIVGGHDDLLDGRFCPRHQIVEALRRSGHAKHDRNGSQTVFPATLEELLHDGSGLRSSAALHTTVGLINDEVQAVVLLVHRVLQRFPDGEGASVALLCQITALTQLLGIQEIDMPIVQHLLVEGFIGDVHALVEPNLIRLQVNLAARLLVELRRIREPDKDGIRLVGILFIAEIDGFNQRRQNDGFASAGRSGERKYLRCMGALVGAEGLCGLSPQLEQRHLLKRE